MPNPAPTPIPVSPHPPVVPVGHVSNVSDPPEGPVSTTSGTSQSRPTSGPPSLARQAWNLARSLADFVADGCKTVTAEQYEHRLAICDGCDHRRSNRCMKCGCRLSLKAQGRAFQCPEGKWPAADCDQEK